MEDIQQKAVSERNNINTSEAVLRSDGSLTHRQQTILTRVHQHGFATIESLASELHVSGQTIRREMLRLEQIGEIRRFHGGAGLPDAPVRRSYAEKTQIGRDSKDRIARRVADEIAPGMAVFLDVGTTLEAVARALVPMLSLQVFTNSLHVASILADADGVSTFVTGGAVRGRDGSLTGDVALQALGMVRCDIAVIGFSGFEPDGSVMDFDHDKIAAKRTMMRHARRSLLVGHSAKFGQAATVRLCGIEDVSAIVTDGAPPSWVEELARRRQIPIMIAG